MTGPSPVRLVNLTQHDVVLYDDTDQVVLRVPVSGRFARLGERRTGGAALPSPAGPLPVVVIGYDERIVGLPDPETGVAFVVSRITAAARPRADVYFQLDEVRDSDGRIVGCRALGQFEGGGQHAGGS